MIERDSSITARPIEELLWESFDFCPLDIFAQFLSTLLDWITSIFLHF